MPPRGSRRGRPAPVTSHAGLRDGARPGAPRPDRPGAAAQELAVDWDLRPGGPGHAAGARRAVAGGCQMTALGCHVQEYLTLRRSFGFKLEREEQLLAQFVACLLYTSDAADDLTRVDLGGRRIIKKK